MSGLIVMLPSRSNCRLVSAVAVPFDTSSAMLCAPVVPHSRKHLAWCIWGWGCVCVTSSCHSIHLHLPASEDLEICTFTPPSSWVQHLLLSCPAGRPGALLSLEGSFSILDATGDMAADRLPWASGRGEALLRLDTMGNPGAAEFPASLLRTM